MIYRPPRQRIEAICSVLSLVASAFITKLSTFISSILLSRGLSPQDFSVFAYFTSLNTSLNNFGGAGIGQVVLREAALASATNRAYPHKTLDGLAHLTLAAAVSVSGALFLLAWTGILGGKLGPILEIPFISIICASLFFTLIATQLQYLSTGFGNFKTTALATLLSGLVFISGCLVAYALKSKLAAYTSQAIAAAILVAILLKGSQQIKFSARPSVELLKNGASTIASVWPIYVSTVITSATNIYLLTLATDPILPHGAVGAIYIAQQWKNLALLTPTAIGDYLLRRFSLPTKGTISAFRMALLNGCAALAASVLIALCSANICDLHGINSNVFATPISIYSFSATANAASLVFNKNLIASSHPKLYLLGDVAWCLSAVLFCVPLMKHTGLSGYAAGLVGAGLFQVAIQIIITKRVMRYA